MSKRKREFPVVKILLLLEGKIGLRFYGSDSKSEDWPIVYLKAEIEASDGEVIIKDHDLIKVEQEHKFQLST